jgi:hypothetical protein
MKRLDIDRDARLMSTDELHVQTRLIEALLALRPRRTIAEPLLTHQRDLLTALYVREGQVREPRELTDEELDTCIELVRGLSDSRPRRMVAVPLFDYMHSLKREREEREA